MARTEPQARVRYHTVAFRHADSYALDVMQGLLNGQTGRLHKAFVLDQQVTVQKALRDLGMGADLDIVKSGVEKYFAADGEGGEARAVYILDACSCDLANAAAVRRVIHMHDVCAGGGSPAAGDVVVQKAGGGDQYPIGLAPIKQLHDRNP